jgi:hypothetical protein
LFDFLSGLFSSFLFLDWLWLWCFNIF